MSIHTIVKTIARKEAIKQLRELYIAVSMTLKYNPHNTFIGTPSEYIRKYTLAKNLKREVYQKYGV
jgi:predicted Holliday junction resolvase-like endonuclease